MELLVMFASWQFDGVTWGRWCPIQERDVLAPGHNPDLEMVAAAMDVMFGDAGIMYVFVCRRCRTWPVQSFMQCA
jgi:hypothetical protein